jgi:hypothetical protein
MRKVLLVLALSLVAVLALTVPAAAAPASTPLYTYAVNPDCGNENGGGTVELFRGTVPNTMRMKLTLAGAQNDTWPSPFPGFEVTWHWSTLDYSDYGTIVLGTIYPDNQGDAVLVTTLSPPLAGVIGYHFQIELRIAQPGHLMQYAASAYPGYISFVNYMPLKLPLNLECGNTLGGGFVALDDGALPNTVEMKVILDGALPNQGYDVIWSDCDLTVGTLYTDKKGDGKFVCTLPYAAAGNYFFRIDLRLHTEPVPGLGLLRYATSGLTISVD